MNILPGLDKTARGGGIGLALMFDLGLPSPMSFSFFLVNGVDAVLLSETETAVWLVLTIHSNCLTILLMKFQSIGRTWKLKLKNGNLLKQIDKAWEHWVRSTPVLLQGEVRD